MRSKLPLCLGLLGFAIISGASDSDKKALLGQYAATDKAIAQKDVKRAMAFTAPDCIWIRSGSGEKLSFKDVEAQLTRTFKAAKTCKNQSSVKSIVVNGKQATVKTVSVSTLVVPNKQIKKDQVMVTRTSATATWMKKDSRWLLKKVVTGDVTRTVDGRPWVATQQLRKPRTD